MSYSVLCCILLHNSEHWTSNWLAFELPILKKIRNCYWHILSQLSGLQGEAKLPTAAIAPDAQVWLSQRVSTTQTAISVHLDVLEKPLHVLQNPSCTLFLQLHPGNRAGRRVICPGQLIIAKQQTRCSRSKVRAGSCKHWGQEQPWEMLEQGRLCTD